MRTAQQDLDASPASGGTTASSASAPPISNEGLVSSADPDSLGLCAQRTRRYSDDLRLVAARLTHHRTQACAAELEQLARRFDQQAAELMRVAEEFRRADGGVMPPVDDLLVSGSAVFARRVRVGTAVPPWRSDDRVRAFLRNRSTSRPSRKVAARLRSIAADRTGAFWWGSDVGDGMLVEVFGDPATADHVAVLVPGMTNTLDNYPTELRVKSMSLYQEMQRQAGSAGATVAVVSWLGYDTPDLSASGLLEAAGSSVARDAAARIRRDVDLLRQVNPDAHLSLIGHSYGSVVLGEFLRSTPASRVRIDEVIAVGSPGMNARRRSELGHEKTQVWATAADAVVTTPGHSVAVGIDTSGGTRVIGVPGIVVPRDPVRHAPAHGTDPASEEFGSKVFSSAGTKSHGAYFEPGALSLVNIARVTVGRSPRAVRVRRRSPLRRAGKVLRQVIDAVDPIPTRS